MMLYYVKMDYSLHSFNNILDYKNINHNCHLYDYYIMKQIIPKDTFRLSKKCKVKILQFYVRTVRYIYSKKKISFYM